MTPPSGIFALTGEAETVAIGSELYITPDATGSLTAQTVVARHNGNLRGEKDDSSIRRLSGEAAIHWLVFSVANRSDQSEWLFDPGTLIQGRTAGVLRMSYNGHEYSPGQYVRLSMPVGTQTLQTIRLEIDGALPMLVAPTLTSVQSFFDPARQSLPYGFIVLCMFLAIAGAFVLLTVGQPGQGYSIFAGYFVLAALNYGVLDSPWLFRLPVLSKLPVVLFGLTVLTGIMASRRFLAITAADYRGHGLSMGAALFIGLATLLYWPVGALAGWLLAGIALAVAAVTAWVLSAWIAFESARSGRTHEILLSTGWGCALAGGLLSALAFGGILPVRFLFIDGWWLSLVPQGLLFLMAALRREERARLDERQDILREGRAAQSLAKLQQSKETADQARLLRVIERERELMTELREREILRTGEMREARDAADRANQAKSAFLAVVSHEIRTPMNGVMGLVRLLKDTPLTPDQKHYLAAIDMSGETMMALLNDILDFEKIETGKMTIETIGFALAPLVESVATLMRGQASAKNIALVCDIAPEVPAAVKGDPTRLRQVLLNLTGNAIKFTAKGGVTIRVRSHRSDDKHHAITFSVQDTGIGISEEAQRRLFKPFEQADSAIARKYGGTGLGLAICQRLIDAMGGTIALESREGAGSTFSFMLILEQGSGDEAAAGADTRGADVIFARPLQILIVEDNNVNREVLKSVLEKMGHSVAQAVSGEEALETLRREPFDLAFTDIMLPGISGLELARAVRDLPGAAGALPLIAITGNVAEADIRAMEQAGLSDYMQKPVDFDRLPACMARVLSDSDGDSFSNLLGRDATDRFDTDDNDSELFDAFVLNGLQSTLGNEALRELMKGFVDTADTIADALAGQKALAVPDAHIVRDRAHEIKGMAGNFGVVALARAAATLERKATDGAAMDEAMDRLALVYTQSRAEIVRRFLNG